MATIYAIVNGTNLKHYIGCTSGKPQKRFREHRCLLRSGKHACPELQADWNRLEEFHFWLVSLETGIAEDVPTKRARELFWMDWAAGLDALYNERRISFQPPPSASGLGAKARVANGYRPSPESNLRRRLAQLGIPKGHGAKISATKRANKLK